MFNSKLENSLLVDSIVETMLDYVPIQPDIDETKVKSAANMALTIDIKRVIKQENVDRCINPQNEADEELLELVIPAYCWFTYANLLKHFQGVFTDGGYAVEEEAQENNSAKSKSADAHGVAEVYFQEAVEFLQLEELANNEDGDDDIFDETKMTPSVRVFGGVERRASN